MSVNNTDLRIVRTKELIRDALIDLIDEKSFDAITVRDITNKAGINRGTFYAHYQDKFDLVATYEDEIIEKIAKIAKQSILAYISSDNTDDFTMFPQAVTLFECFYENGEFLRAILSHKGDLSFQTRLKDFVWDKLFSKDSEDAIYREDKLLVPGEYLAAYISSAHLGVIQQWLNTGKKESPEEMARILFKITVNGPFYAAGIKK